MAREQELQRPRTERPQTIRPIVENRRARYEYAISEDYEAGIQLLGTEVKSLRQGKAQLSDGYAHLENGELWLENVHISAYKEANQFNHEEKRKRKLLLHAKELRKLESKLKDKGVTLVPLSLYFKGNKVKVKLGLARGKKSYDKRESIKARDVKREISRGE